MAEAGAWLRALRPRLPTGGRRRPLTARRPRPSGEPGAIFRRGGRGGGHAHREVLLLLRAHLPGTRRRLRAQRLQGTGRPGPGLGTGRAGCRLGWAGPGPARGEARTRSLLPGPGPCRPSHGSWEALLKVLCVLFSLEAITGGE